MSKLIIECEGPIATITLNHPKTHNAFDEIFIKEILEAYSKMENDSQIAIIILKANGKSFSAGADLNYMKSALEKSHEQNVQESKLMSQMFLQIQNSQKVTLAICQGYTLGGGMGLLAAQDFVFAHQDSVFGFSEAKLGLTPSVISPFVIQKIGLQNAKKAFLLANRFDVEQAIAYGLVDQIFAEQPEQILCEFLNEIQKNSFAALFEIKTLIKKNQSLASDAIYDYTCEHIATVRKSKDAITGMTCFLNKEKPNFNNP